MMLVRPIVGAAWALALFTLSGVPAGATTPVSGALNAVANASMNGVPATDLQNQSWTGAPMTLSTGVAATAVNGTDFITTTGDAEAIWASADSGQVLFNEYGWNFSVSDPNSTNLEADLTQGRGGDDWSYTFTATQNGTIVMDYNSIFQGGTSAFGLWGWAIDFTGSGSGFPVLNASDPTQSGAFTGILVAGQTYTIGLNGNPNIAQANGPANFVGLMAGNFSWAITASSVPEPSTWALMLLGFGGLAFAGRRRMQRLQAMLST